MNTSAYQDIPKGQLLVSPKERWDMPELGVVFAPNVQYNVDALREYPDGLWFGFKNLDTEKVPFVEIIATAFIIVSDNR